MTAKELAEAEILGVKDAAEAKRQIIELEKAMMALLEKLAALNTVERERDYNLKVQNLETEREHMRNQFDDERIQK